MPDHVFAEPRIGLQSKAKDEEELGGDGEAPSDGRSDDEAPDLLGSWKLNRLLAGVRRRLAESLRGVHPRLTAAEQLMASVRTRELVALATDQPDIDRVYFSVAAICNWITRRKSGSGK
jgi:hypothetical protein